MFDNFYKRRGASLTGYGLIVGLISIVALGAVTGSGENVEGLFSEVAGSLQTVTDEQGGGSEAAATPDPTPTPQTVFSSCDDIAQNASPAPSTGYSFREINPTGSDAFSVYCYFDDGTYGGGGFTMVLAQFDSSPVLWDEGRQPAFDGDILNNGSTSFALTGSDIPTHSHTLFGRYGSANSDFIDAVPFVYSTGNIPTTTVTGVNTSNSYHIHRSNSLHYTWHDPDEGTTGSSSVWDNTLTLDQVGTTGSYDLTWSFSPQQTVQAERGFGYGGASYRPTNDSFAWVVLVR